MRRVRSLSFNLVLLALAGAPGFAVRGEPVIRRIAPDRVGDEYDDWLRDHVVGIDPGAPKKNRLFVYFPGTRAEPHRYSLLVQEAARLGLHAISLSYPNRYGVNFEICPYFDDPDCHGKVRREILYGEDATTALDIDPRSSAIGRLVNLLKNLDASYPNEGWGQYVDAGGNPAWGALVVSGHSQGAGHATMIARDHRVARLIIFAWTDSAKGDLAPWLAKPFATPAEDLFAFEHIRDRGHALRKVMWQRLGMTAFGPDVRVENSSTPYDKSHTLTTDLALWRQQSGANPHNSVAVDDFTPLGEGGKPIFAPVWRYLLDVPGAK